MIHATFAEDSLAVEAEAFLSATRLEVAKAFRVFRDSRRFELVSDFDFLVRVPGRDIIARFGHPGPWAVTLEPKVSLTGLDGRRLRGERAAAPVEEYANFFSQHPDVKVLARFNAPHLDAWARGGVDFPFIHAPLTRTSLRQGVQVFERGSAVAALSKALSHNFAGVVHLRGGAVIASEESVISISELILLIEQAAQVELLSELWSRSGRLERRREEEKAPSWA